MRGRCSDGRGNRFSDGSDRVGLTVKIRPGCAIAVPNPRRQSAPRIGSADGIERTDERKQTDRLRVQGLHVSEGR